MWIEDIIHALYFINRSKYCIDRIENNIVFFSDHKVYSFQHLLENYELINKGLPPTYHPELYD